MASDLVRVRRALVSVFDKSGLELLGPALIKHKITVLSTGGTAKALRAAGVDVTDVADVTKWPEMLGKECDTHRERRGRALLYSVYAYCVERIEKRERERGGRGREKVNRTKQSTFM